MKLKNNLQNLRNELDFFVRSKLRWGWAISTRVPISAKEAKLQAEVKSFLKQFNWKEVLKSKTEASEEVAVADVGARNFYLAPVIEDLFRSLGYETQIHGIELDAYRRLSNLHTRADYGCYYANLVRHGEYHAKDFLEWNLKVHGLFLLNPFVTQEPLLDWGLPLSVHKPKEIFSHAFRLLKPRGGFLLLSSPTEGEFDVATQMAQHVGFQLFEQKEWLPDEHSLQKRPRYGELFLCQ